MIATTTGFEFADLVETAVQRAGGETATAEDVVKVRRNLRIMLEDWAARRFNTWRIEHYTVGAGGSPSVSLSRDIDDVITVNSRTDPSVVTDVNESTMTRIGPEQYFQITRKETPGRPSQWYLDRKTPAPKLFIYPIGRPDQTEILDVYAVVRPVKFGAYSNDVDAPGRWLSALVAGCALHLAETRPVEGKETTYDEALIGRLERRYDAALTIAQDADRQRTPYRFRGSRRR